MAGQTWGVVLRGGQPGPPRGSRRPPCGGARRRARSTGLFCITVAHLLGLQLHPKGPLSGRVLTEAIRLSHGALPKVTHAILESEPAENGLKTTLKTQSVGGQTYFDAAGFAGRTVGLDSD